MDRAEVTEEVEDETTQLLQDHNQVSSYKSLWILSNNMYFAPSQKLDQLSRKLDEERTRAIMHLEAKLKVRRLQHEKNKVTLVSEKKKSY